MKSLKSLKCIVLLGLVLSTQVATLASHIEESKEVVAQEKVDNVFNMTKAQLLDIIEIKEGVRASDFSNYVEKSYQVLKRLLPSEYDDEATDKLHETHVLGRDVFKIETKVKAKKKGIASVKDVKAVNKALTEMLELILQM